MGGSFVTIATSWLNEFGATEIKAWVTTSNTAAIEFYESRGFVATGVSVKFPSDPSLKAVRVRLVIKCLSVSDEFYTT